MADDVSYAAVEFKLIASRLQELADRGLLRELQTAVHDAAEPIVEAIRRDTPEFMPRRGGYAGTLAADLSFAIVNAKGRNAGAQVRVSARGSAAGGSARARRSHTGRKVKLLNAGDLSHPLFGNREHWYHQAVRPGFVTRTAEDHKDDVKDALIEAMRRVAEEATGR